MTFCAAYLSIYVGQRTQWYKDHLYRKLVKGDSLEQIRAASALVQFGGEEQLLQAVKCPEPGARSAARKALEFLWFNSAGSDALHNLEDAIKAADEANYDRALAILDRIIAKHPDYAEAYNRRASVYWEKEDFEQSISDSEQALKLNPNHYGAWQGIGVCRLKQGEVAEACRCLRKALKIVPYDETTRRSLKRCEELLRVYPAPGARVRQFDMA